MKKILFLGAATFQMPPIAYARQQGYKVITADNRPANEGHTLAHKSYNISTVDREKILQIAQKEQIDGILTYGSDVSAPTVAYVAEQMNLIGAPLKTVEILTNKALFRAFLQQENLQNQAFRSFGKHEECKIAAFLEQTKLPLVVKPVDASGSRGVALIRDLKDWQQKIDRAFQHSICQKIIIESYIVKQGFQICGDGYMENGRLVFVAFGDGHFYADSRYLAPYGETFPSSHSATNLQKVRQKLESILQKVGYHTGTFNLDVMITTDNQVFVNEIGPRSGGNYLPLAIKLNTGVDLIAAVVEACYQPNFCLPAQKNRSPYYYACYMIHSQKAGILESYGFAHELAQHLVYTHPYQKLGSRVYPFFQANAAIANVIFRFDSEEEMRRKMACVNSYCWVKV